MTTEGIKKRFLTPYLALAICLALTSGLALAGEDHAWLDGPTYDRGDIDGEVGHRLSVGGPKADCTCGKSKNWRKASRCGWAADIEMVSGTLPPGLTFNSASGEINGIPTQRGHWIVKVRVHNIWCGGMRWDGPDHAGRWDRDNEWELRFHISGTGKVVE